MPSDRLVNVRLLVLGMLHRAPMHGYELRKLAEQSRIEAWTGVLPGSIYHALRQLEREELVSLESRERTGKRARAVYAITPLGRVAFRDLVREAWREPARSMPTALYGALAFPGALSSREERAALTRQIEDLRREIAAWEKARPLKRPMTEQQEALYDNGLEHLQADLRLLERLDGRLSARSTRGTVGRRRSAGGSDRASR